MLYLVLKHLLKVLTVAPDSCAEKKRRDAVIAAPPMLPGFPYRLAGMPLSLR